MLKAIRRLFGAMPSPIPADPAAFGKDMEALAKQPGPVITRMPESVPASAGRTSVAPVIPVWGEGILGAKPAPTTKAAVVPVADGGGGDLLSSLAIPPHPALAKAAEPRPAAPPAPPEAPMLEPQADDAPAGLPALLTVGEVATRLAVSLPTIYREIRANRLASMRVGGVIRVTEDALVTYLNQCRSDYQPIPAPSQPPPAVEPPAPEPPLASKSRAGAKHIAPFASIPAEAAPWMESMMMALLLSRGVSQIDVARLFNMSRSTMATRLNRSVVVVRSARTADILDYVVTCHMELLKKFVEIGAENSTLDFLRMPMQRWGIVLPKELAEPPPADPFAEDEPAPTAAPTAGASKAVH